MTDNDKKDDCYCPRYTYAIQPSAASSKGPEVLIPDVIRQFIDIHLPQASTSLDQTGYLDVLVCVETIAMEHQRQMKRGRADAFKYTLEVAGFNAGYYFSPALLRQSANIYKRLMAERDPGGPQVVTSHDHTNFDFSQSNSVRELLLRGPNELPHC